MSAMKIEEERKKRKEGVGEGEEQGKENCAGLDGLCVLVGKEDSNKEPESWELRYKL